MNDQATKLEQSINRRTTWTAPFVVILMAHFMMDGFSGMVPSSLGLLQERWQLTDQQGAWLLGLGSLCSGLAQPLFAWISDRTGNRIYGGLGLTIAGLLLSSIGLATSAIHLFAFYSFGMVGNGMFHPIAASTIGQLNPGRRSQAISYFFVAGMLGGIAGATLGPRLLVLENGFEWLRLAAIPAVLLAVLLHQKIRGIEHRVVRVDARGKMVAQPSHWGAIALLYCSAATRFLVTLALIYLYVRWTEANVAARFPRFTDEQVSRFAAPLIGNINAASIAGMAVGGFASGVLIPSGREKLPYVLIPLLGAPVVALIPHATQTTGCFLAFAAGLGLASLVPVTISLAQRLMPGRTSLASGLMMGGAWAVSMFGPAMAEWIIKNHGINTAFYVISGLMALSGIFALPIKKGTISRSVEHSDRPISNSHGD